MLLTGKAVNTLDRLLQEGRGKHAKKAARDEPMNCEGVWGEMTQQPKTGMPLYSQRRTVEGKDAWEGKMQKG